MKANSEESTVKVTAASGSYRFTKGQQKQYTLEGEALLVRAVVGGKEYKFSNSYSENDIPSEGKVKEVEISFSIYLPPSSVNCSGVNPSSLVRMYQESFKDRAQLLCSEWLRKYGLKMSKKRVCRQTTSYNSHCHFVITGR
ncbi:MAG: hypothetical protein WAX66_02720 [Patescibacteria group bacterium]